MKDELIDFYIQAKTRIETLCSKHKITIPPEVMKAFS
jgi:hypothetical protein